MHYFSTLNEVRWDRQAMHLILTLDPMKKINTGIKCTWQRSYAFAVTIAYLHYVFQAN